MSKASNAAGSPSKRLRIGIGGIAIESSTFSPIVSTEDDFTVHRGREIIDNAPYFEYGTFAGRQDVDWYPILKARSLPGGPVHPDTYAAFKREIIEGITAALPLDGFFYDIHGAMSVVGMDDAEGDLITAIREAVGPDCIISTAMDLHGNVSDVLVGAIDIFTAYRQAPHVDAMETKARGVNNLLHLLDDGVRPYRAWTRIPVILPGERTSTFWEPGATVYGKLAESDPVPGVLDASLWVGYVWADQPRSSATVVVTGTDPEALRSESLKIAQRYWNARHDFDFDRPSGDADFCIREALALEQKGVVISDSGDNPTAGGAGDVPHMTERLLAHPDLASGKRTAIVAAVPNPEAVRTAKAAGVGQNVEVTVGGWLDTVTGYPLELTGTVYSLYEGDPVGGDIAVVRVGGVHVIIPSRRKPYHKIQEFRNVQLDPAEFDLIVVKIGYLEPELRELATASWIALTPGAVNQDIPSLDFQRVVRPVFPLDPNMLNPAFDVHLFPPIG